jgi:transcription elongation factor
MALDLGSRKLDKSDKINNNYSNNDFADKYIKKKKQ